jgi:hypothetical protein
MLCQRNLFFCGFLNVLILTQICVEELNY